MTRLNEIAKLRNERKNLIPTIQNCAGERCDKCSDLSKCNRIKEINSKITDIIGSISYK